MKKLILALGFILVLSLTACSRDEEPPEHANDVFTRVRAQLKIDIEVEEATYACTFIGSGEEAGTMCIYAIKLMIPEFSSVLTDYVYIEATLFIPDEGDAFFYADKDLTRSDYQHLERTLKSDNYQRQVLDSLAENPFAQDYTFIAKTLTEYQIGVAMEGVN